MEAGGVLMLIDLAVRTAAANEAPYSPNPFSEGLMGSDLVLAMGEMRTRVRVWRAYSVEDLEAIGPDNEEVGSNAHLYIELQPAATLLVWRHETTRDVEYADIGLIRKGQTAVANLPDEVEFAQNDRVLFVDSTIIASFGFLTSGEERDELPYRHTSELVTVIGDGQVWDSEDYQLIVEADGSSFIKWEKRPDHALITYRYHPEYRYVSVDRTPPKGADGKRLPQRGILTLQMRGEHDE
jgi:hypothetical protein